MAARVVQHEIDHLDGVLILDRTTDEARREALATLRPQPSRRSLPGADRGRRHSAVRRRRARTARRPPRGRGAADAARPAAGPGPQGRRPPAKVVAERLGIPVLQPERPTAELDSRRDRSSSSRTGCLIPDDLLERGLWLNVHPSLLPALARRRARRARAARRRPRDRRDDPRDRDGARRRPDRRAARVSRRRRRTMPASSTSAPPSSQSSCSTRCSPGPVFRPQEDEATYAEKIEPDDRVLDLSASAESREPDSRALAAHRRARRATWAAGDDLARAREDGRARAARGAAGRRHADDVRGISARSAVCTSRPRARPPTTSSAASFEEERLRRPCAAHRGGRASTSATGRSRSSSPTARCSACARSTTRSRRSAAAPGAQARSARARSAAPRRVPARLTSAVSRATRP